MVPNPVFDNAQPKLPMAKDTLQRSHSKKVSGPHSRPAMRCRSSMSVEELSVLTRKMNIQMAQQTTGVKQIFPVKIPFGRSNSAPADMEHNSRSKMMGSRYDRYGSYSDGSVSSTGSSVSYMDHLVNVPIAPPSRYHTSARFHRRVTFNERVEVFELPAIPPEELNQPTQYNPKQRIKRIKNDTVKFHDQKALKRPTSRVQQRMTSYIKDKLKSH